MNILLEKSSEEFDDVLSFNLQARFGSKVSTFDINGSNSAFQNGPFDLVICNGQNYTKIRTKNPNNDSKYIVLISDPEGTGDLTDKVPVLEKVSDDSNIDQIFGAVKKYLTSHPELESSKEEEFVSIRARLLINASPLESDLYVRLSDSKFVKLYNKGDSFSDEMLRHLEVDKKIDTAFIKRSESGPLIIKLTEYIVKKLLNKKTSKQELRILSMNTFEIVHELTNKIGFTPEVQELAKENVRIFFTSMEKHPKLSVILNNFKKTHDKFLPAHSLMLAHISCCLAAHLEWKSANVFQKFVAAAFFHDLSIMNLSLASSTTFEDLSEVEKKFSPEEVAAYKLHPLRSGGLVATYRDIPQDVETIVTQHHERPDGSGFPKGLHSSRISPLAALFIISHDLVMHAFKTDLEINLQEFLSKYGKEYHIAPFKKILETLETISTSKAP